MSCWIAFIVNVSYGVLNSIFDYPLVIDSLRLNSASKIGFL